MTELSGTLDGVGLPAIVRFLIGLKKSGSLRLSQQDWHGDIFFDSGQVTSARLGSRTGLGALDALVEALPGASFAFDSQVRLSGEPTIRLNQDTFLSHLDELSARVGKGQRKLPAADALPALVFQDEVTSGGDEPLPLDRGTLQTLLFVDGHRSVREIVAQRATFDALWQLASLIEVGLIRVADVATEVACESAVPVSPAVTLTVASEVVSPVAGPMVRPERPAEPLVRIEAVAAADVTVVTQRDLDATVVTRRAEPNATLVTRREESRIARPFGVESEAVHAELRCPKLGFNDDAGNSFSRPTRLHRCFAAGTPLPLSLDQQRELCLNDQFATCPRLSMAVGGPMATVRERSNDAVASTRSNGAARSAETTETEIDDPRIVRLPFAHRPGGAEREAVARPAERGDRVAAEANGGAERASDANVTASERSERVAGASARAADQAQRVGEASSRPTEPGRIHVNNSAPHDSVAARPTPLRSRVERANGAGSASASPSSSARASAVVEPPLSKTRREAPPRQAETIAERADEAQADAPVERRIGRIPVSVIATAGAVVLVIAAIGYLLVPQFNTFLADDSIDPSLLPNSSLVAAGTPVTALNLPRTTPVAVSQAGANGPAAEPTAAASDATTQQAGSASTGAAPQASPTSVAPPTPGSSTAQPAAAAPASVPAVAGAQTTRAAGQTLFDEHFTTNDAGWPSNPQGVAWTANGSYRIATRQAGQFVAIGAPIANMPADVVVNATFRKLAGPAGGGYGIILRDQGAAGRDGTSQDGHYYVLEVGDKGEIGSWRREADHWVDLLPWQHSDLVKPGNATNEVSVRAVGSTLTMTVNGTIVTTKVDGSFIDGGVGLFVGGDGNQVAVDHFSVQTP